MQNQDSDTTALDAQSIGFIRAHPFFKMLAATDQSAFLSVFKRRHLEDGESLSKWGEPSEHVYFLRSGVLEASDAHGAVRLEDGSFGNELVLGAATCALHVDAIGSVEVLSFPVRTLQEICDANAAVKSWFYDAHQQLSQRMRQRGEDGPKVPSADAAVAPSVVVADAQASNSVLIGWLCTVFLPLLTFYVGSTQTALQTSALYFLAILCATVCMWIFELVPTFVGALFSLLAVVALDVVPDHVALAGFASDGFFMLLSIFAIGAMLVISGLTYRISLLILKVAPTDKLASLGIFLYGLLLTPIIPSQLGRGVITAPFLTALVRVVGKEKMQRYLPMFYSSALGGVALFASIFLTGKPANLIVFSLFDYQTQFQFSWGQWLVAASFSGFLLFVFFLVGQAVFFRQKEHFALPVDVLSAKIQILGPMTAKEWGALAAILFFMLGIFILKFLSLQLAWISLFLVVCLFIFGVMQRSEINTRVDWTSLVFIASIVTWAPIIHATGIDTVIASLLKPIGQLMKTNFVLFAALLSMAVVVIRFALPELVTEILLLTMLLPLAASAGISPWVIGFIVLTVAECYIFKYQAPYFLQFENELASQGVQLGKDEKYLLRFNVYITLSRVVVVLLSIPFWKLINIL